MKNELRKYLPESSVVFRKTKAAFGGLSNMCAGYPVIVNGYVVRSSEVVYQMCKHPLTENKSGRLLQEDLLLEKSPMSAKMLALKYEAFAREDWMNIRVKVMKWSLRMKLACNPISFGNLLISTGDKPIVEFSNKDSFWGAKLDTEEDVLVGQNILGRLLMELREELRLGDPYNNLRYVNPPKIPNFLFLDTIIEPYELCHKKTNLL